ncbi:ABC transporter permease subunit [Clostridium sp. D2Q-11]|uniref:ABC transporter permease subunit n=1 Tax=Anaeromonas frigoriresistens TaxID=2683708 RepID=A0A942Z8I8_9FIRM|nr:ABC transporter permease subunit [Anaeromonas frigoriresistens]
MKDKIKPYILLLPIMTIIFGIFASGLIMGFMQSLGRFEAIGMTEFTLRYYKEVLIDKGFLSSFGFSFYISIVSSVIAVVVGVILAYLLLINKHKKGIEEIIYRIPIIVPHTVASLLVFNILAQSGVLPRILNFLGIINEQSQFPALVFDKNGWGIIFSYIWKEIPFIAMVVYTVLKNINDKLRDVALNLGSDKKQVFFHILLPLMMPSIISSFIIVFAFSFGAFEAPYLLGPTSPKALPVKAFIEYNNPDLTNRPYAMVINMILTFFSVMFILIYYKVFNLINRYSR